MRFIIDFENSATDEAITGYLEANDCSLIQEFDNFERTYLVEAATQPPQTEIVETIVPDDQSTAIQLLSDDSHRDIEVAQQDNWWKLAVISNINLEDETVRIKRRARGFRVYVLDSGIDEDHPDFEGKDITLLHSVTPDDFSDTTGHGTSLASVMVGETCGITECAIKVVKIFHEGRPVMLSDLVAAFDAIVTDYVAGGEALAIMNMSWATAKNAYLEQKIQDMIEIGIIAVSSAGNSGVPIENVTPASMRDVITVGSFGEDLQPSDFSNYTGPADTSFTAGETNYGALDYFAPGEAIRIAKPDGTFGYTVGTSIAAAITSAILSLRIAESGYSWDRGGEDSIDKLVRDFGTKDLLTLEGQYADSPNLIPSIALSNTQDRQPPRTLYVEAGQELLAWAFSPELSENAVYTGPEWMSIDGNYIVGSIPEITERSEVFPYSIKLTNIETQDEQTVECILVVRRADVTHEEAKEENREIAIEFNLCHDYCLNYCCTCCEGKFYQGYPYPNNGGPDQSWGFCKDCYNNYYGCQLYDCLYQ